MSARGLHLASFYVTLQVDKLRLDAFSALGNDYVGVTHNPEGDGHEQCPIQFCIPKKDRAGYTRAVAAFNEIMDAHDVAEAAKNARRRSAAKPVQLEQVKPRQPEEALS